MKFTHLPGRLSQSGRTLIELMVVVALGLLIILGVGALYFSSSRSTQQATESATVTESGQVALTLIGASIRPGGDSEIVGELGSPTASLLFSDTVVRSCTGQGFKDLSKRDYSCADHSEGGEGDVLMIAYQAELALASPQRDAPLTDCLGDTAPSENVQNQYNSAVAGGTVPVVRNVYYLENGSLMCLGNGSDTPQPLVSGVTDLRFFFGYDDTMTPASVTFRPSARSVRSGGWLQAQSAASILTAWERVVSVYVCVEVEGAPGSASGDPDAKYLPCPDADATTGLMKTPTPVALPDKRRARQAYTQVFALRPRAAPAPTSATAASPG